MTRPTMCQTCFRDSAPLRSMLGVASPRHTGASVGDNRRYRHELAKLVAALHVCRSACSQRRKEPVPRGHPQGDNSLSKLQSSFGLYPHNQRSPDDGHRAERDRIQRWRPFGGHGSCSPLPRRQRPTHSHEHRVARPPHSAMDDSPDTNRGAGLQSGARSHDAPGRKGTHRGPKKRPIRNPKVDPSTLSLATGARRSYHGNGQLIWELKPHVDRRLSETANGGK